MDLGTAPRIPLPWRVQVALLPLQSVEVELALQIMVQHLPVALVSRDALAADLQERARQMEMLFLQLQSQTLVRAIRPQRYRRLLVPVAFLPSPSPLVALRTRMEARLRQIAQGSRVAQALILPVPARLMESHPSLSIPPAPATLMEVRPAQLVRELQRAARAAVLLARVLQTVLLQFLSALQVLATLMGALQR